MNEIAQFIGHITVTVVAVVALAIRIEHRLTKIETDVSWLKNQGKTQRLGGSEDGDCKDMDET